MPSDGDVPEVTSVPVSHSVSEPINMILLTVYLDADLSASLACSESQELL